MNPQKPLTQTDMQCPCGCQHHLFNPDLLNAINRLRSIAPFAISITSAYRCKTHNAAVGGTPRSQHLTGNAADLLVAPEHRLALLNYLLNMQPFKSNSIGLEPARGIIHVDTRPGPLRWAAGPKGKLKWREAIHQIAFTPSPATAPAPAPSASSPYSPESDSAEPHSPPA